MSRARHFRRRPPTIFNEVLDVVQLTDRKGGDNSKVIIIPAESASYITGKIRSAYVTTRSDEEWEDCLVCDGGATCTLMKSLENCSLCKPKVVVIQTAHGTTIMNSTHLCYKTYYVCDRLGEIRPIIVKAYVVPGLKHDLLSVKGLNKAGYSVYHHPDPEKSGVYAVVNNKIDRSKSFPFMSEHSSLSEIRTNECKTIRKAIWI
jgi:hypothetical protein